MKCWGEDDLVSGIILAGVFRAMSRIADRQTVFPDKIIILVKTFLHRSSGGDCAGDGVAVVPNAR